MGEPERKSGLLQQNKERKIETRDKLSAKRDRDLSRKHRLKQSDKRNKVA
jgi:hypothetical protein